jgi:predicted small integral membrane protein
VRSSFTGPRTQSLAPQTGETPMMIVRLAKIAMTAGLAAFAFIVTYDNLIDYDSNYEFVKHVLSMDTTFPGNKLMGRAITDPALWTLGYALIIAGEAVTFVLLATGVVAMLRARHATAAAFQRAKAWIVAGVAVGFAVWFVGFMVVGGEYFAMWQSRAWNGQEAAFRFYITLLAVLIFVNQPDGEVSQ